MVTAEGGVLYVRGVMIMVRGTLIRSLATTRATVEVYRFLAKMVSE